MEVRHSLWFQDLAYNFFANNDICLAWGYLAKLQTPHTPTDFINLSMGIILYPLTVE
ncbi:MAG TPA: hypothetical protein VIY08_00145 [Candidatus Nitrosocosmicus sp.]